MAYHPDYGTLGTKLSKHIRLYHQEIKDGAPLMSSQITSKEWLNSLEQHRQRVFNKYQRGAILLKQDYLNAKNSINKKMQDIFYPASNSFDEAKKQTALLQRNLAITQMSNGKLNENGLMQQIENDFVNGNIDANGQRFDYLLTHDTGNLATNIKAIAKLKDGFNALGLDSVNELKRDVETASDEFRELTSTFQV